MAILANGTLDARMQSVAASPRRILLADDNEVVRSVERILVETNPGLEVCGEAVDGIDVIQKARELKPDLILLDHRMPGLSGVEAASIIKQAWPNIRIVLFTMYGSELSKAMISAAHIDAVLGKPDGLETLLESIQNLLEPAC